VWIWGERELPGDEVDDGDHLGLGAVATSPAFGRLDERVLRWTLFVRQGERVGGEIIGPGSMHSNVPYLAQPVAFWNIQLIEPFP